MGCVATRNVDQVCDNRAITKDGPGGATNAVIPGLTPTEEGLMSIMLAHGSDRNQTPTAVRRVP